MIQRFINWIFRSKFSELEIQIERVKKLSRELEEQKRIFNSVLKGIDVSVDVHEYKYASSWAVICLQGQKSDFIKFVELGDSDIFEISKFLRSYENSRNVKIDASPQASMFLRVKERF